MDQIQQIRFQNDEKWKKWKIQKQLNNLQYAPIHLQMAQKIQQERIQFQPLIKMEKNLKKQIANNSCPICCQYMLPPLHSPIMLFPCGHSFCNQCTQNKEFKIKNKCPLCRHNIKAKAVNIALKNFICLVTNNEDKINNIEDIHQQPIEQLCSKNNIHTRIKIMQKQKQEILQRIKKNTNQIEVYGQVIKTLNQQKSNTSLMVNKLMKQLQLLQKQLQKNNCILNKQKKKKRQQQRNLELIDETLNNLYIHRQKELILENAKIN